MQGEDMEIVYAGKSYKAEIIERDKRLYLYLGKINVTIPLYPKVPQLKAA